LRMATNCVSYMVGAKLKEKENKDKEKQEEKKKTEKKNERQ